MLFTYPRINHIKSKFINMKQFLLVLLLVPSIGFAQTTGKLFNHTEVGKLAGPKVNSDVSPTVVNTSLNYGFNERFSMGLTTGVEFYNEAYVPLALNMLISLNNNKTRPYLHLLGGTLLPIGKNDLTAQGLQQYYNLVINNYPYNNKMNSKGGMMLNPAFGIITEVNNNLDISFSIGYRHQKLKFAGENSYEIETNMNRLSLKAGFILK